LQTRILVLIVLAATSSLLPLARAEFPRLFDPNRHMRIDEVKPGMKGYGLTVFLGTEIERFDVEVVSVMRNFNPKRDAILIRCSGETMEHVGAVAGMSGSPIFLRDADGHDRMIGAFAYGWALAKDPIAGVQPIEYMLALADNPFKVAEPVGARAEARSSKPWDVLAAMQPTRTAVTTSRQTDDGALRRILTPVSVSGVPARVLARYSDLFAANQLAIFQAGGGIAPGELPDAPIKPGSVIITPLVTGDVEFHANGTCTEVLDGKVFAFGHPFNNEGAVELPFAEGAVQGIVASLGSSFKMAAMGKVKGVINTDHTVGIAGEFGTAPATVPIDVKIIRDGRTATFHFDAIRHARLLPILVAISVDSALAADGELPQYSTARYDVQLTFENDRALRFKNVMANFDPGDFVGRVMSPLRAAAENPFERVLPTRIEVSVSVNSGSKDAQILSVQIPKTRFRAGDTLGGFVTYRPFRGEEADLPFEFELPRDLPDGTYQLVIGDSERYFADELTARPFRFSAENGEDVFAVMQEYFSIPNNAIFVRLMRQPDGVAVGRVALNHLPASRRQVLLGAGRSNVTEFAGSAVKQIETDAIMTGSAEFTITVDRNAPTKRASDENRR